MCSMCEPGVQLFLPVPLRKNLAVVKSLRFHLHNRWNEQTSSVKPKELRDMKVAMSAPAGGLLRSDLLAPFFFGIRDTLKIPDSKV